MNFKKFTLVFCVTIWSLTGYSQRNPDNEILVFFSEGITQKVEKVNGASVKTLNFSKAELKRSLNAVGIPDSLMEFALPDFKREDTLKILSGGKEIKQPDMSKLIRVTVSKDRNRKDMTEYLNSLPEVLYAEPNGRIKPDVIPTDTRFGEQWGLRNTINTGADIHAVAAWDIYTGNSNNIIAIIDGGTQTTHEDLNSKIAGGDTGYGWDGHGIHVSGIAAAESNNAQGISGVDWNARIHPQKIDNLSDDADAYQAIVDAVNYSTNVRVLNSSWGLIYEDGDPGRYSSTVRQAFAYAYKANRTSVASMGNHQQTDPGVVNYPGGFDNVIAVGATDNADVIANFSVQNNHIDVCAPGVDILSTVNGGYDYMSGTSMATPHVSGVASLLKGYNPNLANDDIENIIQLSADDRGATGFDNAYGYGRLNAERALNFLQEPYALRQWTATSGSSVGSTGTFQMVIMGASGLASATYIVKRHEVQKTVTFPENFLHIEGVWTRGAFTTGWNLANPNFGEGFCEIVPGTLTETEVTLRTYVYEVWNILGSSLGYYPSSPANVTFTYTVLGVPLPTISGPSVVCDQGTYTISNPPQDTSITWASSSSLLFSLLSGQGTTSATFEKNMSLPGTKVHVTATINTGCGNDTILYSDDITLGTPTPGYTAYTSSNNQPAYGNLHTGVHYYFQAEGDDLPTGDLNYRWTILVPENPPGVDPQFDEIDYGPAINYYARVPGQYTFKLKINGTCGWSNEYSRTITFTGEIIYNLLLYPNPASDMVTVSLNSQTENSGAKTSSGELMEKIGTYDIQIWNEFSGLVKTVESDMVSCQIPVSGLPEGLYFVHLVIDGKTVCREKLQITK
jgi:subtilisin family serine protease